MTTYPNGRIPLSELAVIPGGTKMGGSALIRTDLLPGFIGMQAACLAQTGRVLQPTSAADGNRDYDTQVRTFLGRYKEQATGEGPFQDVRFWQGRRYVRFSAAGSAAVPGTSNHGKAQAVDLANVDNFLYGWLEDNAGAFGWQNPLWARDANPRNGSREPWHWEGIFIPVSNFIHVRGVPKDLLDARETGIITTLTPLEDDMTDDDRRLIQELHAWAFGTSGIGPSHLAGMIGDVPIRASQAVHGHLVSRVEGAPTTFLQDQTDGVSLLYRILALLDPDGNANLDLPQAVVNPDQLAAALAPLLEAGDTRPSVIAALSKEALDAVANAVVDEIHQRSAS